jgi:hypothetical protein
MSEADFDPLEDVRSRALMSILTAREILAEAGLGGESEPYLESLIYIVQGQLRTEAVVLRRYGAD